MKPFRTATSTEHPTFLQSAMQTLAFSFEAHPRRHPVERTSIFTTSTSKALPVFIDDLDQIMRQQGFFIHNRETIDMAASFARHDLEVDPGFDLHMIQICKPGKAAFSLGKNPRRAVLMPKFITVFSEEGRTVIQFLMHGREEVSRLVDDPEFPDSLADTYKTIIALIEASC